MLQFSIRRSLIILLIGSGLVCIPFLEAIQKGPVFLIVLPLVIAFVPRIFDRVELVPGGSSEQGQDPQQL